MRSRLAFVIDAPKLLSKEVYWNYGRIWLLRLNGDFYLILGFHFLRK